MKNFFLILIMLPFFAYSQKVQWVSKVLKSSSDLGGKQHSSRRVVGRPDVFPQGGDSPNAWAPKDAQDGHDFIEVEFAEAQTVKQIAIFENLNTGCFVKVMVGKGDGKYKEVFRNKSSVKTFNIDLSILGRGYNTQDERGYYFGRKRRKVSEASIVNISPGIEYANLEEPVENVKALRVVFNFKKTPGDKQIDAIGISDADEPIIAEINTTKALENLPKPEVVYSSNTIFSLNAIIDNKLYISVEDENGKATIFSLDKNNGKFENLKPLPESINKNENYNYLVGITGNKFIVGGAAYKKGTKESGYNIFTKTGDAFSLEKPLEIIAFSNYEETSSMSINDDASVIIMAIESDISQGGIDLYFSKVKEDGTYGYLQNLGKIVNSANDEYSPFLCNDSKTLLFASNGMSSYGNDDLYFTNRLDDTWKNWSEPVNLGPIINDVEIQSSVLYDDVNEQLYFTGYKDNAYQLFSVKFPKSLFVVK